MSTEDRARESLVKFYDRQLDRISNDLRYLADAVDQAKTDRITNHVNAATYVLGDIHNALPNLPLGLLVQAARDLDQYDAEAKP